MILILFSFIFQIIYAINLKKFKPKKIGEPFDNNTLIEKMSDLALKKLYYNLPSFNETSCRITAKFILMSIGGIENDEEMKKLNLSKNNLTLNLYNIKVLLNKNYIVQIEIRRNHHFIIFRKNSKELYLLQSFQDLYTLKDWMSNKKIMKPYLTIDDFFEKMKIIYNPNSSKEKIDKNIVDLFMPNFFIDDKEKINKLIHWFHVTKNKLVNVYYTPFNFEQNQKSKKFKKYFKIVNNNYDIKTDHYFNNNLYVHQLLKILKKK